LADWEGELRWKSSKKSTAIPSKETNKPKKIRNSGQKKIRDKSEKAQRKKKKKKKTQIIYPYLRNSGQQKKNPNQSSQSSNSNGSTNLKWRNQKFAGEA
jgi:hypothetical protein